MPWQIAEIPSESRSPDSRQEPRHQLRLAAEITSSGNAAAVVMLDLSESGMMISTPAELAVDEILAVDLPEAGEAEARVAWKRMSLYGCLFLSPVTRAAISAARLKSGPSGGRR